MLKKLVSILLAVGLFMLCCSGCSGCSNQGEGTSSATSGGGSDSINASQSADSGNTTTGTENNQGTGSATQNATRQNPGTLKDIKGVSDLSKLPDYLEGSLEKYLTIEADIEVYPEGNYNLYQGTLQDTEKVYQKWVDAFIPGKPLASQNHMQDMMLNNEKLPSYTYQDETTDGKSLWISNNFHSFIDNSTIVTSIYDNLTNPAKVPMTSVTEPKSKDIVLRNRFPKQDLNGFSKNDALGMVEEKINALGLQNLGEPNVYALDMESVNKWIREDAHSDVSADYYDLNGFPTEWTNQNQECYYITYNVMLDGVKFTDSSTPNLAEKVIDNSVMTTGSILQVYVNQNGIFYFYLGDIYTIKTTQKNVSLINLEQAIAAYSEKYKNAFEQEARTLVKIQLLYVPKHEEDFNFELRPAWVISSQTKANPELPEEEQNYVTKDYVDAITGKMMNYH